VGTTIGFSVQGPYAAGLPLTDSFRPALMAEVAGSRFGAASLARLVLLVAVAGAVAWWLRRASAPQMIERVGFIVLLGGVLLATSAAGHAAAGELVAVALPADAAHLAAVSTWVGGLVMLTAVVLRSASADVLVSVLPRWSRVAMVAVAVVVATGIFASWREVRELPALTATTYG
jgi:copper transport protein